MKLAFCHHLSLSYFGGGEKWIIETSKELVRRGHQLEIYALPFTLEKQRKVEPDSLLDGIPYFEGKRHKVKADVVYITYNPLSWLFFQTSKPRIAGIHAESYWLKPNLHYGLLPNVSLVANKFLSYGELRHFNAVHMITKAHPCNHPRVFYIPNFVDSGQYCRETKKEADFTVAFISRKVWQKGWDLFQLATQGYHVKVAGGQVPEQDMPDFISSAHVSLIPSRVDTFGLAIVESLMCGTPVITTPLRCHELLGIPIAFGESVEDFRVHLNVLRKLWCEEPEKYKELVRYGRDKAMQYDKAIILNRIEQMFREVAAIG